MIAIHDVGKAAAATTAAVLKFLPPDQMDKVLEQLPKEIRAELALWRCGFNSEIAMTASIFSDDVTYEVHASGVLEIASGTDIHLYSPAYWQEVTVDTRTADQRERHAEELGDDVRWQ